MDRLACVDIPALPLQLLMRAHPEWLDLPVVVVEQDAPNGRVNWVNQKAWANRIRIGMRYSAALALSGDLRAGVITNADLNFALAELLTILRTFSPSVEANEQEPGVFFLNASGMLRIFNSLENWTDKLERTLVEQGYRVNVIVGFQKFAVRALALARYRERVLGSAAAEREALYCVPLERLRLSPDLLSGLDRLGIKTVAQFLSLPMSEVVRRFGAAAGDLHRAASGENFVPVQATVTEEKYEDHVQLEHGERDSLRLAHAIRRIIPGLVGKLIRADATCAELEFSLDCGRHGEISERIKPASPTLDEAFLLELIRLRISMIPLTEAVQSIRLRLHPARAERQQVAIFEGKPKRDLASANRALARLRAEFGDDVVGHWKVNDGHLPEARAAWISSDRVKVAAPKSTALRRLIRRIRVPAVPLPPRPKHEPDGWLVAGMDAGPVIRDDGPYIVAGAWWASEIHREYHFVETSRGQLLWIFFDRKRRRWFSQGTIE